MALKSVTRAIIQIHDEGESIYGYEIGQRSEIATGAIYPILARLEGAGLLTSSWEDPNGPHPRRRVYAVADREGLKQNAGVLT